MRTGVSIVLAVVLTLGWPRPAGAMLVFDNANFAQNLVSAIEAVDQTLTQILQYQNQLLQYEEMIRNGAAPAVYTWDKLVSIHNKLNLIAERLRNWRGWLHSLDDYLKKFADLDYYRSARCYGSDLSCPESEWDRILRDAQENGGLGSVSRKKTLDELFHTLEDSEKELEADSENLEKLQRQAQSAKGHMEALQAGNQLASAEVYQLMQIRIILIAQHRAIAVQMLVEQSIEARQEVAGERYRRPGEAGPSVEVRWAAWPR
jgi:P-type conjugative transfer protein TrbJ